jgi:hypothetical protein
MSDPVGPGDHPSAGTPGPDDRTATPTTGSSGRSEELARILTAYLRSRPWQSHEVGPDLFVSQVAISSGQWPLFIALRRAEEQVIVHSVLPVEVPSARREAVALYLTRANFGLVLGNFEMDLDGTDVRYKTSLDIEGGTLTAPLLDHLVMANVVTVDRYLAGLRAVIGGADPAAEIAAIERRGNGERRGDGGSPPR